MKKYRFYIEGNKETDFPVGSLVPLAPEESHHLCHVLRIPKGGVIYAFDGFGRELEAIVESVQPEKVLVRIKGVCSGQGSETGGGSAESAPAISLGVPFLKSDKLETVFRMATQLGVLRFHVFVSHRCVSRPEPGVLEKKRKRWERIILESVRISGRAMMPGISFHDSLDSLLKEIPPGSRAILAFEGKGLPLLSRAISEMKKEAGLKQASPRSASYGEEPPASVQNSICFITGPEGGFTAKEIETAEKNKVILCSLGDKILKAETAPIAAIAAIRALLGDM